MNDIKDSFPAAKVDNTNNIQNSLYIQTIGVVQNITPFVWY
jgi:hypothetical protein